VDLDFGSHVGSKRWKSHEAGKVAGHVNGVDPLDLSSSQLCKFAQRVKIAFISFNRHDIDSDS